MNPAYPRDLIGYGRNPPHARWPGNARIAVQFVLNYEEGGENCVLHGDAGSEQFLSELFNPAAYPDRHLSMESVYEYGSRAGVWRLLREFQRRGLADALGAAADEGFFATQVEVHAVNDGRFCEWVKTACRFRVPGFEFRV